MPPPSHVAEVPIAITGRASRSADLRAKLHAAGASLVDRADDADVVVVAEDEVADTLGRGSPVVVAAEVDADSWLPSLTAPAPDNVAGAMRALLAATEAAQAAAFTSSGHLVVADDVAASLAAAVGVPNVVLFGLDGGGAVVAHAAVDVIAASSGDPSQPQEAADLTGAAATIPLPAADHVAVVAELTIGGVSLPGPWALVGIAGGDLVGAALPLPIPIAGEGIEVVRAMLELVDRGIASIRARLELPLRVRQLDALQQVHVAVQQRPPVHELCHRVAAAMTSGMRYRTVARCEVELDGCAAVVGADGTVHVEIAEDVVVDGRRRGQVRVGYVEPRRLLVPEEPLLADAVVEWLAQYLERQDSQQALAAAAERQRRILTTLPSMIVTVDRHGMGHVIASGPTAPLAEGTTFPLTDLDSVQVSDGTATLGPIVKELLRDAMGGAASPWKELLWNDRWWQLRFEPFQREDDGTVTQALGMAVDITERRRATELESRLAALVDGAHVGVMGISLDGTITDWNEGATRILGWSADEVIGRSIEIIETDPPTAPTVAQRLADIRATGQDLPYLETPRRHRDGHNVDIGISVALVKGSDAPIGLSAIMLDLTERNRALEAMEISERHVQLLADHAHDVVYRVRVDPSRVEYISPSATKVLGYSPSEFYERPDLFEDRTHPEDAGLLVQDHAGRLNAKVRVRWRHADGRWRWLEDRRTPVVEHGVVVGATGIVRDITDDERAKETMRAALAWERRAADQLRQVDELKTAFLSAVSHEVRTPLTSVLGFSETALRLLDRIRDQVADAPAVPEVGEGDGDGDGGLGVPTATDLADRLDPLLDRVVVNAHRLERLVNDLLDVDRLTRGEVAPRRHRVEIHTLVARALERDHLGGRRLITDLRPVVLDVDPVMIDRAVDNLIRNAARHTRPRATVWVRCHPTSFGARVVVEDDGDGVPAEFRERVFQPFQQGPGVDGKQSQGTGIGLSLVRQFVEVHGGEVVLEERAGGGARFVVDLPAYTPGE